MSCRSEAPVASRAFARASMVSPSMLTRSIASLPRANHIIYSRGALEGPAPERSSSMNRRRHDESLCLIRSVMRSTLGRTRRRLPQSEQVANGVVYNAGDRELAPFIAPDRLAGETQFRRHLLLRKPKSAPGCSKIPATHGRAERTT